MDNFAGRKRDRNEVEVDRLEQILQDVSRSEIVEVLKKLDEYGVGRFLALAGRRGASSRFKWDVSLRSAGKATAGQGPVVAVTQDQDEEDAQQQPLKHEYRLRPDFTAQIDLPVDLTAREAERLAEFIKTLPFEG